MSNMTNRNKLAATLLVACTLTTSLIYAQPPAGQQGERRGGPPEEAFEACASQSEGDACRFSMQDEEVTGSCVIAPREESLHCMPEGGGPKPPPRPSN